MKRYISKDVAKMAMQAAKNDASYVVKATEVTWRCGE